MTSHRAITSLSNLEALAYFTESKQYVNFSLPPYFNFDGILLSARSIMNGKSLADVCARDERNKPIVPSSYNSVNYVVLTNKDGGFAWRPMQIIHPVLYIDLINIITNKTNWEIIKKLFRKRNKSFVECISMSLRSENEESNVAASVTNWWDKIEQESIRKSLDYKFLFQTDISNCYPSIYTHSIEWSFHSNGRLGVKKDRSEGNYEKNLGTEIDVKVRNMNHGQTIGIPQGSVVMDLIAEIVLAGTDMELTSEIKKQLKGFDDFKILRFRDDYRIFTNEYQKGHEIMKILSNVLYEWNMKMNTGKTSETSDIISSSVKKEKLEEIYVAPIEHYFQKAAMRIYILSKKYPNAGLIAKLLTNYFDKLSKKNIYKFDFEVVIGIIAMIAYHSPRYMPQAASIISRIIEVSDTEIEREAIITRIVKKFDDLPNTEVIDIWLQRIADAGSINKLKFNSTITKVATGTMDNSSLWNSDWLNEDDRNTMNNVGISNLEAEIESGTFNPVPDREEFELYRRDYF